jgi:hypothetical protein
MTCTITFVSNERMNFVYMKVVRIHLTIYPPPTHPPHPPLTNTRRT